MYKSKMSELETQIAITKLETFFLKILLKKLNLIEIKGPLFVEEKTGLNDHLSGIEIPLKFQYQKAQLEIVQSLAKWKRTALREYDIKEGQGIIVQMNAIRPNENVLSHYHSLHVDQYDWEKVISEKQRNKEFLFSQARNIYEAIKETKIQMKKLYKELKFSLVNQLTFISSEKLLLKYPKLTPKEREYQYTKKHKAIFIHGIGHKLSDDIVHGLRAPDYDDWNINGDLVLWDETQHKALEISSMGIRVNSKTLEEQSKITSTHNSYKKFHNHIINNKLPLTIGGGIGISRLNMFILEKTHISEVQSTYWPKEYKKTLLQKGIKLLK